jgi:hypothetical protein
VKKKLTVPSLLFSPAGWRGLIKGKDFNGTPHFYSLPQGERRDGRKLKEFLQGLPPHIDGGGLRWG